MKQFIKKIFKKFEHNVDTGFIGSYSFYDDFLFKKECKEFIDKELLPKLLPTVEYNKEDVDRTSPYHQYYIKMVILKKFAEILFNEIDKVCRYLKYPEKSYHHIGPRD